MKIEKIMSKKIISVSPDDTVSSVISLIEEHCLREIIVAEKNKLKGIIYSKKIADRNIAYPSKTKANTLMNIHPATLSPSIEVDEAAKLIFKTGLRALPVIDNNKLVGVVSMRDIILHASGTNDFKQTKAESIMSPPETITKDTDIGEARKIMREKGISRLPIVDEENNIVNVVTIFDLLKAVKPKERLNFWSMTGEKLNVAETPISVVSVYTPTTIDKETNLSKIVEMLKKYNTDGVVVVKDKLPIGIVTEKDLLEFYISTLEKKGIYYQIIGLVDEDDFTVSTIDSMVRRTLESLSKIYNIQFFFLHVKRYDKKGRIKYSIRARLLTGSGTFVSKAHKWDIRTAVGSALDKLNRITKKERERLIDRKRK